MPLTTVFTDRIRPEKAARYRELVQELAQKAVEKNESFRWTAHQTTVGATNSYHYVAISENFAGIDARGEVEELFARVLGDQRAAAFAEESAACIASQQVEISTDRPDLSYAPESDGPGERPWAVVTVLRPQPGHQEAAEELLRKVAEAIPKVSPEARMLAFQPVIGDLSLLWTVRPIESLAGLDSQPPVQQLLEQAFGSAEGGLAFRSGLEAIQSVQRDIVVFRPELSNPE